MIDQRIIELEHYINHIEDFTLDIIADKMMISKKQLTRLLKKWDDEGVIEYVPGRGRGNKVTIKMKRDVQIELIDAIKNDIKDMSVLDLQRLLQQPWHHHSFLKLQTIVDEKINEPEVSENNEFTEWVRAIPEHFHPAHINDYLGAQLSHQLFDTLYRVSGTGEIIRSLVSYDEWIEDNFHIHLKKQVKFSDGTILTAREVKASLDYCRSAECPYFALFSLIEAVEVINDFYVEVKFSKRPKYFEYLLTQKYSAIYKRVDPHTIIGSGPYQLDQLSNERLTIRYNLFYRGHLPDIEKIKYLNKSSKINDFESYKKDNNAVVYITTGEEFLLFNPHKDLSLKQRAFISHLFKETLDDFVGVDERVNIQTIDILTEDEQINRPLNAVVNQQTKPFYDVFKATLSMHDIQLQYIEIDPIDYINTHLMTINADFIWMYENYHSMQPFKTIDLLRQCKFQEWYGDLTESYKLMNDHNYRKNDALINVGHQYFKRLNRLQLFVPIRRVKRKIYVSEQTKNVDELPYGIVNYIDVIIDD
ncbi:ABC transporter substrate-binding protein [Macrococcoides caseolyticum]|uniref:ABC transporter substrate-binding protein n=1 Tax=Macrococcoides caseolyticum TaxID=69966 RepID=UPI001F1BF484|nr:ABC transporter substrate-binding protein [Macrococcus caseolyticus]MCE4957891.1 SgrR family transcriptional regulator [Macrococcus caseolyticus]